MLSTEDMEMRLAAAILVVSGILFFHWRRTKHSEQWEQWALWLSTTFIYSVFFDVGTHRKWFQVSEELEPFLSLRLVEYTVYPVLVLAYTDGFANHRSIYGNLMALSGFLAFALAADWFCIHILQGYRFKNWDWSRSLIAWTMILGVCTLLLQILRIRLKEPI